MEADRKVKLKKQITVTDLAGEKVMVDFDSGKYYMIKGVGNDIWDMIQAEAVSPEEILERLLKEYDVTREVCSESVYSFLDRLDELGWLE